MEFIEKKLNGLFNAFDYLARLNVFIMMILVVADIVLRKPLWPIPGTYDYVSFLGAMAVAFALPYSAVQKGHIEVELLVSRFSQRVQRVIGTITGIMSFIFFVLVSWQSFALANNIKRVGEVSMSTHLPFYPFIFLISLMFAFFSLVILFQTIKQFVKAVKGGD
jgi:TRAP-type C4-dicarboxylate transport system permease small subunit